MDLMQIYGGFYSAVGLLVALTCAYIYAKTRQRQYLGLAVGFVLIAFAEFAHHIAHVDMDTFWPIYLVMIAGPLVIAFAFWRYGK
jgi:hypothetical protein